MSINNINNSFSNLGHLLNLYQKIDKDQDQHVTAKEIESSQDISPQEKEEINAAFKLQKEDRTGKFNYERDTMRFREFALAVKAGNPRIYDSKLFEDCLLGLGSDGKKGIFGEEISAEAVLSLISIEMTKEEIMDLLNYVGSNANNFPGSPYEGLAGAVSALASIKDINKEEIIHLLKALGEQTERTIYSTYRYLPGVIPALVSLGMDKREIIHLLETLKEGPERYARQSWGPYRNLEKTISALVSAGMTKEEIIDLLEEIEYVEGLDHSLPDLFSAGMNKKEIVGLLKSVKKTVGENMQQASEGLGFAVKNMVSINLAKSEIIDFLWFIKEMAKQGTAYAYENLGWAVHYLVKYKMKGKEIMDLLKTLAGKAKENTGEVYRRLSDAVVWKLVNVHKMNNREIIYWLKAISGAAEENSAEACEAFLALIPAGMDKKEIIGLLGAVKKTVKNKEAAREFYGYLPQVIPALISIGIDKKEITNELPKLGKGRDWWRIQGMLWHLTYNEKLLSMITPGNFKPWINFLAMFGKNAFGIMEELTKTPLYSAALVLEKAERAKTNPFDFLESLNPEAISPKLFEAIGEAISSYKSEPMLKQVYDKIKGREDEAEFKKYSRLLIQAASNWDKDVPFPFFFDGLFFSKLQDESASQKLKLFCVSALAKLIESKLRSKLIARKLLALRGKLETFTLRNLVTVRDHLPKDVSREITEKVESLLVQKTPPYKEWFDKKLNPNKVITAKVYFQIGIEFWRIDLKNDGFIPLDKDENILEKKVNGVTLRVIMEDVSNRQSRSQINIFKALGDPAIQYIVYNGHAGMGGNLEIRNNRDADDPTAFGAKLIHIAACASVSSYSGRALKAAPGSQFIGNIIGSRDPDDVIVFLETIKGIANQKSWDEIDKNIKEHAPFSYHLGEDRKESTFFNYMLPNNIDQFKYAILNEFEPVGAESLSFEAPRQELAEINQQFGGRLRQAAQNVNVAIIYQPFFEGAEITTGSEVYDGIYFLSQTDDQAPTNISPRNVNGHTLFELKVNAGYSHISVDALSILLLYEINNHFSINKNGVVTKEDKLRGMLMAAEYIHYHYQGREHEGLEIFDQFKQRYGFANEISFEDVYNLQKAIDDSNQAEKERLEKKIMEMLPGN